MGKKAFSGVTVTVLASVLLAACGGVNSDPTSKYQDLGPVVPPHTDKARTQTVLERSYVIEPEKDVTFIEGETASFKIHTRLFFPVDSYDLKISAAGDELNGLQMIRSTEEPGTYIVTWSAPKGFIPTDRGERSVRYRLELTDIKSSDANVESVYRSVSKVQEFSFGVRRTGKTPQIVKVADLPSEITQGSVTPFAIEVMDPASYDGFAPRVDVYFQGTNKTESGYEANGATYVRNESLPKNLGGGLWRFEFVFDTKNNDVGAQLDRNGKRVDGATHLQTRMLVKAYSASGGVSGEKLLVAKIKYAKPQVAEPKASECVAPAAKPAKPTNKKNA